MKHNKGFSLVELVVVMSIALVLLGVVGMSVNVLTGMDAKKCLKELNGCIKSAKTNALSRDDERLLLYRDSSDGCYYAEFVTYVYDPTTPGAGLTAVTTPDNKKKIGKKTLTIVCTIAGTDVTVGPDSQVTFQFDRSTGAFGDTVVMKADGTTGLQGKCTSVTVSRGPKAYTITMIPETGKHYINS